MSERLAVLGLGLLGGSVAWSARARGLCHGVVGYDRDASQREIAAERGMVDRSDDDPRKAVAEASLVVLATPSHTIPDLARQIAPALTAGVVLTDVASVKAPLCEALPPLLPEGVHYVGSHPMAGGHGHGAAAARVDLIDGAAVAVTPIHPGHPATERVAKFWRELGARVVYRSPGDHDLEVAWISHLPHVLAFIFAEALRRAPEGAGELVGSGFRDFTRIGRSSPELWADILEANADALAVPLKQSGAALRELGEAIQAGDRAALVEKLTRARAVLETLDPPKNKETSRGRCRDKEQESPDE